MPIKLVTVQPDTQSVHDKPAIITTLRKIWTTLYLATLAILIYLSITYLYYRTGRFTGDPNTITTKQSHHMIGRNPRELTYYRTVLNGYTTMAKSNVIVVGLIRDHTVALQRTIDYLYSTTLNHYADYRILIVENDSKEDTKQYIAKLQQFDNKVISLSEDYGWPSAGSTGAFSDDRFTQMAVLRNKYLHHIRQNRHDLYSAYNELIVLDLDSQYGWSVDGLAHTYGMMYRPGHTDVFDVMCANGIYNNGEHFDTLAYRDSTFTDTRNDATQRWKAHKRFEPYSKPVPVHSCFGGMTVYNMSMLTASECEYTGADCEHVTLHQCLRESNNARVHINPSMLLWYGVIPDTFLYQHKTYAIFGVALPIVMLATYLYVAYGKWVKQFFMYMFCSNKANVSPSMLQTYRQLSDVPEENGVADYSV